MNQAAVRATRPTPRRRTEAEEEQIKEAFARVFAKSPPPWASKLSECRAKRAEKLSKKKKAPEVGVGKPISIKGPKREREGAGGGGVGGGVGGDDSGSAAARKRKSRRVDV